MPATLRTRSAPEAESQLPALIGIFVLPHCTISRLGQNAGMVRASLAVLVIDENRIRASIIEAGLREAGHDNVTIVHDVSGIARRIAETEPDVIVIDLENPNRDMLE